MKGLLIVSALLLFTNVSVLADQTEMEPNNGRGGANGPVGFNETLTGGLPGAYGADNSPNFGDYWSFVAKKDHQYRFHASPHNSSFVFPLDIDLDLENSNGQVIAQAVTNGDNQDETLNWSAPADGTYYLVVYEGTNIPNGAASYTVDCTETAPADTDSPTYPNGVFGGIISGNRINDNTGISLVWQAAQDNMTSPANMQYDVYYSANQATVFSSAPQQTFVGATSGEIGGLNVTQTYYVGVRARDGAGNRETNTRTIAISPLTAATHWTLY